MTISLDSRVKISPFDGVRGKVVAVYTDLSGSQYKIRFFYNMEPKELYFLPDELEVLEDKKVGK